MIKGQMVERMAAVCSLVKADNLQPLEETKVRFLKSAGASLETCRSLGSVVIYGKFKAVGDRNKLGSLTGQVLSGSKQCILPALQ